MKKEKEKYKKKNYYKIFHRMMYIEFTNKFLY